MKTKRTYLYVPYEEYDQLKKLGAHWDGQTKCWYLKDGQDSAPFKRWLGVDSDDAGEEHFVIASSRAFVAVAECECWKCGEKTEVATVYCERGKVDGEDYREFTVSGVTGVDAALDEQLSRWPFFRREFSEELQAEGFINHCQQCGEVQSDFLLHCEPSGPFFMVQDGIRRGRVRLTALQGHVRLNGDECFEP